MAPDNFDLDTLNASPATAFVAALAPVFEHAPWVAEAALAHRPFATVADLHDTMVAAVATASPDRKMALLRAHPELGGKVARAGAMTAESVSEQGSLGLDRLSDAEFAEFQRLNDAYGARFGFPFIICVRRHTRESILARFAARLQDTADAEVATALAEVALIARLRLVDRVRGPGAPPTTGRLSTHVLDSRAGRPAAGVRIELFEIGRSATARLVDTRTNADGRTDAPLIAGMPLRIGAYELRFHLGDHFRAAGAADPPFLDIVPVRFAIAEPEGHYHVPLLATPWSYTTYRGS